MHGYESVAVAFRDYCGAAAARVKPAYVNTMWNGAQLDKKTPPEGENPVA
jgi:hypothetical protein